MVTLRARISLLGEALSRVRSGERRRIDEALLSFGITGVQGEAEVGISSLIGGALSESGQDSVRLDLFAASGEQDAVRLLAKEITGCAVGYPNYSLLRTKTGLTPQSTRRAYLDFAERVGQEFAGYAIGEPTGATKITFSDALDAYRRAFAERAIPPVLWIDHLEAPGLTPRHPLDVGSLLWNVRSLQQHMEFPLVISGHSAATELAYRESGPFYGDGVWLTINRPTVDVWFEVEKLSREVKESRGWVAEMFELTRGHPASMLLAFAMRGLFKRQLSAGELWQQMVALDDGHLNRALAHARTLHRLGAEVLGRIAQGLGPYAEPKSPAKEINKAVQRLHEAGLITQPRPRAWEVTNPLIGERLRRASGPTVPADYLDWDQPKGD